MYRLVKRLVMSLDVCESFTKKNRYKASQFREKSNFDYLFWQSSILLLRQTLREQGEVILNYQFSNAIISIEAIGNL
jgi:hypothetical protein